MGRRNGPVSRRPARRSGRCSPGITRDSSACPAGCGAPCNGGGGARLGGLALLCALGQAPALAATIAVDVTSCYHRRPLDARGL